MRDCPHTELSPMGFLGLVPYQAYVPLKSRTGVFGHHFLLACLSF